MTTLTAEYHLLKQAHTPTRTLLRTTDLLRLPEEEDKLSTGLLKTDKERSSICDKALFIFRTSPDKQPAILPSKEDTETGLDR